MLSYYMDLLLLLPWQTWPTTIFMNKVLLTYAMSIHLHIVHGYFCFTMAVLNTCDRACLSHKA